MRWIWIGCEKDGTNSGLNPAVSLIIMIVKLEALLPES
jgi:hypothetical protein